jgi:feruloyl esterase
MTHKESVTSFEPRLWRISSILTHRAIAQTIFVGIVLIAPSTSYGAQKDCETLKSFAFPMTTMVDAKPDGGGAYVTNDILRLSFPNLPASCRVKAKIKPTEDSDINVEVWLPASSELSNGRYNGRYLGTGNGGYGGDIFDSELAQGINNGFATANTDMGTCSNCAVYADQLVGHPEKWSDFGWRSTHLMTEFSKALIKEFYGTPARHSYFAGCSTGGQQALKEATRYPEDYDGILAGAPAYNRTHLLAMLIAQYGSMHPSNATISQLSSISLPTEPEVREPMFAREIRQAQERAHYFAIQRAQGKATIPDLPGKLDLVNAAVLKTCLGRAGEPTTDKFLTDPRDCTFDPSTLQCPGNVDNPGCLTGDQVSAMKVYYEGAINPRNGTIIHPGNIPGSETGNFKALGLAFAYYQKEPPFDSLFKWLFNDDLVRWATDRDWDWRKFDFDGDVENVDKVFAGGLNASHTDLSQFRNHGGKLILYSG